MRLLSTLAAAVLLPLLAVLVASIPYWHGLEMRDPLEMVGLALTCLLDTSLPSDVARICAALGEFNYLALAALAVAALGLALIAVVQLAAAFTGFSRFLISLAFPSVTFLALICAGVIAIGQAGLLAYSAYLLPSYFFGVVYYYIVVVVALSGLGLGVGVMLRALQMFRPAEAGIIAVPLDPKASPHIYGLVDRISQHFRTDRPENILVGFDPTFFATSAKIHTPFGGAPLTGETLYLSLPLLRMLSEDEVTSIIGHELAHFSGSDTIYSKRFAPAYRGLYDAMYNLSNQAAGASAALALPVQLVVLFVLTSFEPAEKRIGRSRELRADRLGSEVGSPEALCSALVKLSVLGAIWNAEFEAMIARVQQGRITRNMSINFVERAQYDVDHDKAAGFVAEGLDAETAHPTDTHPITRLRIEKLGLVPESFIEPEAFKRSLRPLKLIITPSDNIDEIEEKLTDLYQQVTARHGGVDQSNEARRRAVFSNLLSMLLAKMVVADGKVEPSEIQVAQERARTYDAEFDATVFRESCRHPESIADLDKLISLGNSAITEGGAKRLKDILRAIAEADGEVDDAERRLLETLDAKLVGAPESEPPIQRRRIRRLGLRG